MEKGRVLSLVPHNTPCRLTAKPKWLMQWNSAFWHDHVHGIDFHALHSMDFMTTIFKLKCQKFYLFLNNNTLWWKWKNSKSECQSSIFSEILCVQFALWVCLLKTQRDSDKSLQHRLESGILNLLSLRNISQSKIYGIWEKYKTILMKLSCVFTEEGVLLSFQAEVRAVLWVQCWDPWVTGKWGQWWLYVYFWQFICSFTNHS